MNKMELMSPVGSWESLHAAIKGGCNSVYFGVEQLNMRARSTNTFTLNDLPEVARVAGESNVKTYLTLNTVIYNHDLSLMRSIVDKAKESGINAIIASDQAVLNYGRKIQMPIHISTQANITNIEAVEFYSVYADVMVMARELTLKQVAEIVREIKRRDIRGPKGELIKIEIFGHGALCMAVSGKCYISLHSHNASANRGACVQNCRHSYVVTSKEDGTELEIDNEYIMSAQDLCTIDFLDELIEAGVDILKIEGRGRATEYVYTTTHCYREAIDAFYDGSYNQEKINAWKDKLATVFNRGFWDGYYLGKKIGEWSKVYGSEATKRKVYIGKGMKYFEKVGIGEFLIETQNLQVGDEIMITGPTTGYIETVVKELREDNNPVEKAGKGALITFPVAEKIRPSDRLYKLVNA